MDINRLFILNLKKWRKIKGFSQKDLAEKCGTGHSYIRQLESGVGHPSFAFIGKIANALDIELYQLFYDDAAKCSRPSHIKRVDAIQTKLLEAMASDIHDAFDELLH